VTGGAGYIGSHTCKALARAGFTPVTYDNLMQGHAWAVRWGPFVRGDLADRDTLTHTLERHSIEAVIHFAAFAYVGESMNAPGDYFRNNVANTLTLLEAMQQAGVDTMVFSSTCATYGIPARVPIDEDEPQKPINPYGESKLFVERMLRWWENAHGLRWTALRYFNAAGADVDGEIGEDHEPETHLVPIAIQAAMGMREPLEIFGSDYDTPDGTAVRDYIHVSDLAAAHVAALKRLRAGGSSLALNLGTGIGHSVRDVVDMVGVFGGRVPVRFGPRRAGDPPQLVAAAHRAREVLGWEPRHSSLDQIVATAWHWHTQHRDRLVRPAVALPVGVPAPLLVGSRAVTV
jgi:UDP-glucose-4-epimerase GalE